MSPVSVVELLRQFDDASLYRLAAQSGVAAIREQARAEIARRSKLLAMMQTVRAEQRKRAEAAATRVREQGYTARIPEPEPAYKEVEFFWTPAPRAYEPLPLSTPVEARTEYLRRLVHHWRWKVRRFVRNCKAEWALLAGVTITALMVLFVLTNTH